MGKQNDGSWTEEQIKAFREFIRELGAESDRAVIIRASIEVESLLRRILEKFLLSPPHKDDHLFEGERPLGSLSVRINIAYRLGLIDKEFRSALHCFRDIRNKYAHKAIGAKVDVSPLSGQIRSLCLCLVSQGLLDKLGEVFGGSVMDGRGAACVEFVVATFFIVANLNHVLATATRIQTPSRMSLLLGMRENEKSEEATKP